jgi:hypothetical protein
MTFLCSSLGVLFLPLGPLLDSYVDGNPIVRRAALTFREGLVANKGIYRRSEGPLACGSHVR